MPTMDKEEREVKEEQVPGDESKQSLKKKSRNPGTRRRTKTGCLTCRQRRVKCDETKPTCRNCDKSRRLCAGYQSTAVRQPSQIPPLPTGQFVPQFAPGHPMPYNNLYEVQTPYDGNMSTGFFQQDIIQRQLQGYAPHDAWPFPHDHFNVGNLAQWSPSQDSLNSAMISSQPYTFDSHLGGVPAMHTVSFSAYPGMQRPLPPSKTPSHRVNQDMSRSTSSTSVLHVNSNAYTDSAKSSFRGKMPEMKSAPPSQASLAGNRAPSAHLYTHHDLAQASSGNSMFDEDEDPDDPWDVENDDGPEDLTALSHIRPTQSLVLDERMAYLMSHFCNYLRPCISIWERPVRFDGSSTFAEKLPILALSCRGLLHGLMAVSALHLAVLHKTSEVVPLKHFVIASKKLNKLLTAPQSRHTVESLSLCLLLAFYSVILGDHAKWAMHLKGCSAFLMEHDFAGFLRAVHYIREHNRTLSGTGLMEDHRYPQRISHDINVTASSFPDDDWSLDENLIRNLTGLEVDHKTQKQPSATNSADLRRLTSYGVEQWKTKMDLFSWYIKMDIFHSTLSGDRLLLPYHNWRYFAPRGRIGLLDKVYATMDHLLLVLGRLADFGAKDRERKQRRIASTGGQWRPEPGFLDPPRQPKADHSKHRAASKADEQSSASHRPSANEGRTRIPKAEHSGASKPKKAPPLFFGMMPPPKIPPSMLSSFHVMDAELRRGTSPDQAPQSTAANKNLESATADALKEHQCIADALETWKSALGNEFLPDRSASNEADGPFTPVIRHADPSVACLWSFYHLGKILLRRYHPYSPPAMMVSSAVNAPFTNNDAMAIGQLFAGLLKAQAEIARAGSINPTLVASLQEITFPLMFAGVQYTHPMQRRWTIDNLSEVGRDSGWKSAFSVASALETSWTHQGGYQRTLKQRSPLDAMRYDQNLSTSGEIGISAEEQHTSRFETHDRRLIDRFSDLRAFWAVGVVSTQDDLEKVFGHLNLRGGG